MSENPDDYIDDEEEIDENKRRLLCGLGAFMISLPFMGLGVRKSLSEGDQEEEKEGSEKKENAKTNKGKRRKGESALQCLERNETVRGKIERVLDGDTFDISTICGKIRNRVWGSDCPESSNNKKCQRQNCDPAVGKAVTKKVKSLAGGKRVTLEGPYKQNGNRILAYVRMGNGKDLGLETIKKKWCIEGPYDHDRKRQYKRYKW